MASEDVGDCAAMEAPKNIDLQTTSRETAQLRRVTESEARMKGALDQAKRSLAEQKGRLDQKLQATEAEVSARKEAAIEAFVDLETTQLSRKEQEKGLPAVWEEIEDAAAAVKEVHEQKLLLQRESAEHSEAADKELEVAKAIKRMYDGVTGIHWDDDGKDGSRGFVAIDKVKRFDVSGLSDVQAADAIWDSIEASLGPDALDDFWDEPEKKPRAKPVRGGA